ncbi:uncharacterized protein LOC111615132 [Centruroides sculpturatus]|uniref:uncharacterized protein LOC111615132 n=1 Tax=Centruroides sculpturatus TaxID=218467 RepID=UPI000C6D2567|nr:uncharacterized protein LOC111615132 [Centruroides sculpturatus]
MNKILFIYAFLGIILSYNVDGAVVAKSKYYEKAELFSNPFKSEKPVNELKKAIESLISHLENNDPNKTLLAQDIENIRKAVDKVNDNLLKSMAEELINKLNDLKSEVKDASKQVLLDASKKVLKEVKSVWKKIKEKFMSIFS